MGQTPYGYIKPAAAQYSTAVNPVAPASTSAYKMQGLGYLLTPVTPSGQVRVDISANLIVNATTVGIGVNLQLYYGPMVAGVAAPANAAAIPASAVQIGGTQSYASGVTLTTAADSIIPIDIDAIALGLTPGQQYWFDLAAESIITASACQLTNVGASLYEIG